MTTTVRSTIHLYLTQTFRVHPGHNVRRYHDCGGQCSCGYPVAHSAWTAPDGYSVRAEFCEDSRYIDIIVEAMP